MSKIHKDASVMDADELRGEVYDLRQELETLPHGTTITLDFSDGWNNVPTMVQTLNSSETAMSTMQAIEHKLWRMVTKNAKAKDEDRRERKPKLTISIAQQFLDIMADEERKAKQ